MSFKGFQKGLSRAPQQFKAKFNLGEHTKDPIYLDAERRFQDLEVQTRKLHDESRRYSDAINGMLSHQIEFSQAMTEIYKPISGSMSDPDSYVAEGNVDGIRACEEYEAVVKELQETLAPELEMIETRVIQPATELLDVIKVIQKTAVKREHKKLDYDRHRAALKKLQDKKEKTLKDEKALYKAESDMEQSTQDFEYFNSLLKEELPRLFALERQFIQPLFQSFYYMQLNIFYTLHEKMQQMDIGYFNLTLDIEDAFEQKRGDIQARTEQIAIVRFKTTAGKRPQSKYGNPRLALEGGRSKPPLAITAGPSSSSSASYRHGRTVSSASATGAGAGTSPSPSPSPSYLTPTATDQYYGSSAYNNKNNGYGGRASLDTPPAYSQDVPASHSTAPGSTSNSLALAAAAKHKPPPPKPKPRGLGGHPVSAPPPPPPPPAEMATALYDYTAAQDGDLSFQAGDVIEIVTRTANANEWWVGKLHGREGQFPGNYVQIDG